MATLDQAIQQMLACGMPEFPPGHPRLNTGKIVRYGPKLKAWYRLFEYKARNNRYYIAGAFGIWQGNDSGKIKIESDFAGMEIDERERLQRSQAELERREQAKIKDRANFAARRAQAQWDAARSSGECAYLVRKGLMPEGGKDLPEKGLRVMSDGTLLVPMVRYDVTEAQADDPLYTGPRRLAGLQKIAPDGSKRFNKGMAKMSTACRIGRKAVDGRLLIVGEGLATVLSAHIALDKKYTFFVAFDSGNLMPVAKILRKLYPKSPILFIADDDAYLEAYLNKRLRSNYHCTNLFRADFGEQTYETKHGPVVVHADFETDSRGTQFLRCGVNIGGKLQTFMLNNPGLTAAWDASNAVGNAWVCWPQFADRVVDRDPDKPRLTDYNDLHLAEGLDRVRGQLDVEVRTIIAARQLAAQIATGVPSKDQGKEERKTRGGKKGEPPPDDKFDWDGFFTRYTYIYPTDTAWDARQHKLVKLSAMRIHFGDGIVNWWLRSDKRRTVNDVDVVFDPTGKCDLKKCINLFAGLESEPSADGSCQKLIELLQFICGEADQDIAPITEWVLNWIAHQVQNIGAKMATAVVMHGVEEGTGKNMFWGAVMAIFGRYGSLITQTQLESPYNGWMSQRLFCVANEVISRQEMRHHVGRLKNYITEPVLPIEEKYMPLRYEANHMNMVFLTNELQALQIGPSDRRYMIIKTPQVATADYYQAVLDELASGGGAAFHHYLLQRDCGEFSTHTKPLQTEAREDLISMGLGSAQLFQRELHEGLLEPLHYGPCFGNDLYRAYTIWSARNGVKNPRPSNLFSSEFMSMNGVTRKVDRVPDPDRLIEDTMRAEDLPQRTVFRMGVRSEAIEERKWVNESCKKFRYELRSYAAQNNLQPPGAGARGANDGDDRAF